jgi:4'-phosphopantetheinyl transferase EntD
MSADPLLARVRARVQALLPAGVGTGVAPPCDPCTLHPVEAAVIAGALPARQREFAGGRAAVREALLALGRPSQPVPMGADRAPVWPPGLRGTITHAAGLCLAAVTADPRCRGLGMDLEEDAPLPAEVLPEVLGQGEGDLHPRLVFSAKESVFKALYPQVGHVFGFDAVRIAAGPATFVAETRCALGPIPAGARLSGRLWRGEGLILTALAV